MAALPSACSRSQLFYVDANCANWTIYRSLLNGYGKTLPAGSCAESCMA
jgi:hypothetical protein